MLQQMAEQDRLEQLSAQRRREKTIQHRHEVERILQQRRAMFEAARVRPTFPCPSCHHQYLVIQTVVAVITPPIAMHWSISMSACSICMLHPHT